MAQGKNPHTFRSWIGTVVALFALALFVVFAWRVARYASLIQSGELAPEDLSFVQELSVSEATLGAPLPEGEFDLATEDDPQLGSPDAKVTIVEFADFGCPYSQKSSFILRSIARRYGDEVRYVYRDFPIDDIHPEARRASEAAECAHAQGKFWEYHDKLYVNQTDLSDERLKQFAREINLNEQDFDACLESGLYAAEVEEDYQAGYEAGVRGTPTFFINGNRIPGSIPEEVMDQLIQNFAQE